MQRSCSDVVKQAIGLAWLTVVWVLLEAAGALFAGLHA